MPEVQKAILITIDQRAEQDAAHHTEDGGIGPDSQRQRQHDGNRKTLAMKERPGRKTQIPSEAAEDVEKSGPGTIMVC
jgi:hypothetical protein